MLVGVLVGVGLTRSTISSFAPIEISHHGSKKTALMIVSTLWRGPGFPGFTQDGESHRLGWLLLTSPVNSPFPV